MCCLQVSIRAYIDLFQEQFDDIMIFSVSDAPSNRLACVYILCMYVQQVLLRIMDENIDIISYFQSIKNKE